MGEKSSDIFLHLHSLSLVSYSLSHSPTSLAPSSVLFSLPLPPLILTLLLLLHPLLPHFHILFSKNAARIIQLGRGRWDTEKLGAKYLKRLFSKSRFLLRFENQRLCSTKRGIGFGPACLGVHYFYPCPRWGRDTRGRVAFGPLISSTAILKQANNQPSNRENGEDGVRGRRGMSK